MKFRSFICVSAVATCFALSASAQGLPKVAATRASYSIRNPRNVDRVDIPRTPLAQRAYHRCKSECRDDCEARKLQCAPSQSDYISLAFLAPDIVKAAIEGRLPRGIGVTRLRDAPVEWSRQHAMLGLSG
jgi:hypothetical protein